MVNNNNSVKSNGRRRMNLPPGYRFKPFDYELILYYLKPKIDGLPLPTDFIDTVNVYAYDPPTLRACHEPVDGKELYFFTPRNRKYKNGSRPSRSTSGGYWKATGADTKIRFDNETVGYKKNLVFYRGNPKNGKKTDWIMHEYRLNAPHLPCGTGENGMKLDDYVLCRIRNNKPNEEENRLLGEVEETQIEEMPGSHGETETVMGYSNIHNPIDMSGNDLFGPHNHHTFRVPQVPPAYHLNGIDNLMQMPAPLDYVNTNEMMMNGYIEEFFEASNVIKYYSWKQEETSGARALENNFGYMPDQSNFLGPDTFWVDGEGSSYNNEEVSNPALIEQPYYGLQHNFHHKDGKEISYINTQSYPHVTEQFIDSLVSRKVSVKLEEGEGGI